MGRSSPAIEDRWWRLVSGPVCCGLAVAFALFPSWSLWPWTTFRLSRLTALVLALGVGVVLAHAGTWSAGPRVLTVLRCLGVAAVSGALMGTVAGALELLPRCILSALGGRCELPIAWSAAVRAVELTAILPVVAVVLLQRPGRMHRGVALVLRSAAAVTIGVTAQIVHSRNVVPLGVSVFAWLRDQGLW